MQIDQTDAFSALRQTVDLPLDCVDLLGSGRLLWDGLGTQGLRGEGTQAQAGSRLTLQGVVSRPLALGADDWAAGEA